MIGFKKVNIETCSAYVHHRTTKGQIQVHRSVTTGYLRSFANSENH